LWQLISMCHCKAAEAFLHSQNLLENPRCKQNLTFWIQFPHITISYETHVVCFITWRSKFQNNCAQVIFATKNTCERKGVSNFPPSFLQAGALPTQPFQLPCSKVTTLQIWIQTQCKQKPKRCCPHRGLNLNLQD
jgi:hypothetical protein